MGLGGNLDTRGWVDTLGQILPNYCDHCGGSEWLYWARGDQSEKSIRCTVLNCDLRVQHARYCVTVYFYLLLLKFVVHARQSAKRYTRLLFTFLCVYPQENTPHHLLCHQRRTDAPSALATWTTIDSCTSKACELRSGACAAQRMEDGCASSYQLLAVRDHGAFPLVGGAVEDLKVALVEGTAHVLRGGMCMRYAGDLGT